MGQDQSHDSDHPKPSHHDSVVHGGAGDGERLFSREVEEDPGHEDDQEDDHGNWVED